MSQALETEYLGYVRNLQRADAAELLKRGVNIQDMLLHEMVGVARVRLDEHQLWHPVQHGGAKVFVSPVRVAREGDLMSPEPMETNRGGELVDLVAWRPSKDPAKPALWYLREGNADTLGTVRTDLYREMLPRSRPAVELRSDVLDWLKHRGEGVLVLTQDTERRASVTQEIAMINSRPLARSRTPDAKVEEFVGRLVGHPDAAKEAREARVMVDFLVKQGIGDHEQATKMVLASQKRQRVCEAPRIEDPVQRIGGMVGSL